MCHLSSVRLIGSLGNQHGESYMSVGPAPRRTRAVISFP